MSLRARILFAIAAFASVSIVSYLSFQDETKDATIPVAAPAPAPQPPSAAPAETPPPPPPLSSPIPYRELTRAAAAQNEIIFTTSAMGEPMEVHPDGTVVIHNHRKVFTFADGRQEVRYARVTAKPTWVPMSGIRVPPEDAPPK